MRTARHLSAALALIILLPESLCAQSTAATSEAMAANAPTLEAAAAATFAAPSGQAYCLAKTIPQSDGPTLKLQVLAPADQVADLAKSGFQPIACGTKGAHLAQYKAAMCELYTNGNEAVQNRLRSVLGVAPEALCTAAKRLLPEPATDSTLVNADVEAGKVLPPNLRRAAPAAAAQKQQ